MICIVIFMRWTITRTHSVAFQNVHYSFDVVIAIKQVKGHTAAVLWSKTMCKVDTLQLLFLIN